MTMTPWEEIVVGLMTEVAIIEPLVSQRVEQERPEGLGECGIAILIALNRVRDVGVTRTGLVWMMEEKDQLVEQEIGTLLDQGRIKQVSISGSNQPTIMITEQGQATLTSAVRALVPYFKPAFDSVSVEALKQATETLREIRRTLDNLPDGA